MSGICTTRVSRGRQAVLSIRHFYASRIRVLISDSRYAFQSDPTRSVTLRMQTVLRYTWLIRTVVLITGIVLVAIGGGV